jgi:hypothetical protein
LQENNSKEDIIVKKDSDAKAELNSDKEKVKQNEVEKIAIKSGFLNLKNLVI